MLKTILIQQSTPSEAYDYLDDPGVQLMLSYQEGDDEVFQDIYDQYAYQLEAYLVAYFRTHDPAHIDLVPDIIQEVFLRIIRASNDYKPTASFKTWIFTITNNVLSNTMRTLRRRKELGEADYSKEDVLQGLISGSDTSNLATDDKRDMIIYMVRMQLLNLPEGQSYALLLRMIEQKTYAEIGEVMGISLSAVKSLLFRARTSLKDALIKAHVCEYLDYAA